MKERSWGKFWNFWELRAMVVLTPAVQILLILFGHKRKSSHNLMLRIVVWSSYLTSDSFTTVALGVLSNKLAQVREKTGGHLDINDQLLAFWSPLLLLLFGHCLSLAVQTSATAYIIFIAWTNTCLSYLSSVMALVGFIKYGERVCALWMASHDKLKRSMLPPPDPSPNYPRFMEEYTLKQDEGYYVVADKVIEDQVPEGVCSSGDDPSSAIDSQDIGKAYGLLQMFKCLFVELILSHDEKNISKSIFKVMDYEKAFRIVEIELGFIDDMLHTKAMVLYTKQGLSLRMFTFSSTLLVLVLFSLAEKSPRRKFDLFITYLLLAVIVFFETYSILMLVSSDWSDVWLCKRNKSSALRRPVISVRLPRQPRWSHSIAQFSLLSFCTKERPLVCHNMLEFLKINKDLEKYHYTLHEDMSGKIRKWIFGHVEEELRNVEEKHMSVPMDIQKSLAQLLDDYHIPLAKWGTEGDLDQVVLTWHIATELLYYSDQERESVNNNIWVSKLLSRYMFYLLVMYPSMLPSVIGEIRLRDTFAEAFKFFKDHRIPNSESNREPHQWIKNLVINRGKRNEMNLYLRQASKMLLRVRTEVRPTQVKGGKKSKSVLFDGCSIVAVFEEMKVGMKWETIAKFWTKILMYAASQCRGDSHARQLRRGGELLTHVWLLMAHFGLTDHFKMTQGQAIAQLILR
ncbi:hypothetical protein ACJRO7_024354 [Eucalyptus globulus]|uniref:DUF4220 domain-containing protein n=1 Tax=Eucalyptus globulus TaxID=34317 RepID=A0ABD3KAJ0_EUCGL